jgi:hypothetical protein
MEAVSRNIFTVVCVTMTENAFHFVCPFSKLRHTNCAGILC